MKTYKFSNTSNDFTKELRNAVKAYFTDNNLSTSGGSKIIYKTIFMSALYFAPFVAMLTGVVTTVPWMLAMFFIMGVGMCGLGMATMHDSNHGSFSKKKAVNKFFSNSLYLLGGFPPNWRFQHNTLHHGYTNIEGHDEDIAPVGVLRFSPHQPLKKYHRYQYLYAWFFYCLMTFSWVTMSDFSRLVRYKKMGATLSVRNNYTSLLLGLILAKVLYFSIFLLLPILFLPLPWYWIVVGFILMHFTSGLLLSTIFQIAHVIPTSNFPLPNKNNEIDNNWTMHQLATTSDFSPNNKIFSWLIGGLNYQVVHHLFPNISHVHYKNLATIVKNTAQKYQLSYHVNNTFFGAVYQHALMLKSLGKIEGNVLQKSVNTEENALISATGY